MKGSWFFGLIACIALTFLSCSGVSESEPDSSSSVETSSSSEIECSSSAAIEAVSSFDEESLSSSSSVAHSGSSAVFPIFVKELNILDTENHGDWSIQNGVKVGDSVHGDRENIWSSLPSSVVNAEYVEYIRTAADSKALTGNQATFKVSKEVTVSILLDSRVAGTHGLPAWLNDWIRTADTPAQASNEVSYYVYKKNFAEGETVTLGTNGPTAGVINYVVAVTAQGAIVNPSSSSGTGNTELSSGSVPLSSSSVILPSSSSVINNDPWVFKPASGSTGVNIDTQIVITFKSAPQLGKSGEIAIYEKNGTRADLIKLSGETNTLKSGSKSRTANYRPVTLSGNTLTIHPHYGKLKYNTEYYVTVSNEAITGVSGFNGVAADTWTFKTKAVGPSGNTVTVDDDCAGADFCTVQAAIDYVSGKPVNDAVTIHVKNGNYEELLYLQGKNNVTIKGESREKTRIHYDNSESFNSGTANRGLFYVEKADMLRLENLTIENTNDRSGGQAEAIYFNSDGRLIALNCNFISRQDTILVKGYNWFYNSLIAGDVDFIWGYPKITLFENCEIRSRAGNGYVLQARVSNINDKGFVFLTCNFTRESTVKNGVVTLARSGGSTDYYDNISIINSTMDSHIPEAGWSNQKTPNPATANANSGWKEYKSKAPNGSLINTSKRYTGSYQLSDAEYNSGYKDRATIFKDCTKGTDWIQ
jgi:pectin methylesterase-like acyl-CoA thioesterase